MTVLSDHPILFIPGPVEVETELRELMSMPLVGHRSSDFMAIVIDVSHRLSMLFQTERRGYFENAPATAFMEASLRNLVNERVLHLTCGAFGERWAKIATACGRTAETLAVEWGQANTADTLREHLQHAAPYDAICITHNETSTGVINPLRELTAVVHELAPDTLILVDAVTSLGGAEFHFDDWGIDFAFAGTQKCLALPPGLCVFALSDRAVQRSENVEGRGYLFDFHATPARFAKGATPATPNVPLVYALQRQLMRIETEGMPQRWKRHLAMQKATQRWTEGKDVEFLVQEPYRSPTVSSLVVLEDDLDIIIRRASDAGFTIGRGYGKLKTSNFRIGHMGDHTVERLEMLLTGIVS